jgi:hypothetical protein
MSTCITKSVQLSVFSFRLPQDGGIRIGLFPHAQELLVCDFCLGRIALQNVGARKTKIGEGANRLVDDDAAMVEDFLELRCGFLTLMCGQVGFAPHENRVQAGPGDGAIPTLSELIRRRNPERLDSL